MASLGRMFAGLRKAREPWQEAPCPHTNGGICLAKCEEACRCHNGEDALVARLFDHPERIKP
ncbi:hypothetical protein [Bradyrhizobium sp. RT10b]|uniref:hypothetical protein n=1 Tax=Bradyrhizobium sp. RT10b TaxID=3156331 RepID=UPI003399A2E3